MDKSDYIGYDVREEEGESAEKGQKIYWDKCVPRVVWYRQKHEEVKSVKENKWTYIAEMATDTERRRATERERTVQYNKNTI